MQVKAAVSALRDVRGLQFPCSQQISDSSFDLLDWLQFCFGFQVLWHLAIYFSIAYMLDIVNYYLVVLDETFY